MWDGGKSSLEDQAFSPLESSLEMHTDFPRLLSFLKSTPAYVAAFASA
jgi:cytochrome c peroxidase